jgi:hypothetical protein
MYWADRYSTRNRYQAAIQVLDHGTASKLCLDFAEMETSLQAFNHARATLIYGAQMEDYRRGDEHC